MPGYEAKFVHPLLKRHECPICLFAMRKPVQTECGHLFCQDCLKPILQSVNPVCPVDKEDISKEGVFPDNACRREILGLEVYCNFMTSGCPWQGVLKDLETHMETCDHRSVQCMMCGQKVIAMELEEHQQTSCPMRPAHCPHCNIAVPSQQMEAHIKQSCMEVVLPCPHGCDKELQMKRPQMEKHLNPKTGECPLMEVSCPYNAYGCSFVSQRQNIATHLQQYMVYHITIQAEITMEMRDKAEKSHAAMQHLIERTSVLEARMSAVEKMQDAVEQRVEVLDDSEPSHFLRGGREDTLRERLAAVESRVMTVEHQVKETTLAVRDPNEGFPHTPSTSGYLTGSVAGVAGASGTELLPQRIENMHSRVIELDHAVDRCMSNCLDQELRLQLLERATYNGVLLWKIDEFERRHREAVSGVTLSLFSTPFYTSRNGYKMCARVYLNGDGMGKNAYLSLFFVVMKGPFDALLSWPFRQKVSFCLVNQSGKKSVSDSFHPDPLSNSFQRPIHKEMNVASGCPMFVRQEHLLSGGFIKDDCIFLRISVDISTLSDKK